MSQVDVSYGILHYNPSGDPVANAAFIEAVDSLMCHKSDELTTEVLIIDQGNPHRERETCQGLATHYGIDVLFLPANVGISRGINMIARRARGEYVSLVTSDTIFTKGLDTTLIRQLKDNPHVMQICPVSNVSSIDLQCTTVDSLFGEPNVDMCQEGIVDHLVQELTIQFWPRRTFDTIGYFDERWKACYENLDFALRIFLAGGSVSISKEAFCWHHHNMTTKNSSINSAYKGYIDMNTIDHSILSKMFDSKWPGIRPMLYYPITNLIPLRNDIIERHKEQIHLPYIQEVDY